MQHKEWFEMTYLDWRTENNKEERLTQSSYD